MCKDTVHITLMHMQQQAMLTCDEVRKLGSKAALQFLHRFAKFGVTYDMLKQCCS
jgi:hypothetical protein